MERTLETRGENLVKGMEHLLADLRRGQLSHTDASAFKLGENIAVTPGKVVHETPMYQLIQYSPSTETVLDVPLVIFPPWINRFYILDLNAKKSFVRWAVEQGITVFMVSWKSADASMKNVIWDDYVRAQMDAIDHIRERLDVKHVHAIGYCVSGTTLAATLARARLADHCALAATCKRVRRLILGKALSVVRDRDGWTEYGIFAIAATQDDPDQETSTEHLKFCCVSHTFDASCTSFVDPPNVGADGVPQAPVELVNPTAAVSEEGLLVVAGNWDDLKGLRAFSGSGEIGRDRVRLHACVRYKNS